MDRDKEQQHGRNDLFQAPDMEMLISHLAAAKRSSFASVGRAYRAQEIVTSGRAALEDTATFSARSSFLRRGLDYQLSLLKETRRRVGIISSNRQRYFEERLLELEKVDEGLKRTEKRLQQTHVDPAFRPKNEPVKSLYDFIQHSAVDELHASVDRARNLINDAQSQMSRSSGLFDEQIRASQHVLDQCRQAGYKVFYNHQASSSSSSLSSPSITSTRSKDSRGSFFPVTKQVQLLEDRAEIIADLLQSLVRHYDLCSTAVKHTEGGIAAARSITGDHSIGHDPDIFTGNDGEERDEPSDSLKPITEAEYREMVDVVFRDAGEADEVVGEIEDHIATMEESLKRVSNNREAAASFHSSFLSVSQHFFGPLSGSLAEYKKQIAAFLNTWNEHQDELKLGIQQLDEMRGMWVDYLNAYDSLVFEGARRHAAQQSVNGVLNEARQKLDRIFEEDLAARQHFHLQQGDFLPSDLWPGLLQAPNRIKFVAVNSGFLPGFDSHGHADSNADGDVQEFPQTQVLVNNASSQEKLNDIVATDNLSFKDDGVPDPPKHLLERVFQHQGR